MEISRPCIQVLANCVYLQSIYPLPALVSIQHDPMFGCSTVRFENKEMRSRIPRRHFYWSEKADQPRTRLDRKLQIEVRVFQKEKYQESSRCLSPVQQYRNWYPGYTPIHLRALSRGSGIRDMTRLRINFQPQRRLVLPVILIITSPYR